MHRDLRLLPWKIVQYLGHLLHKLHEAEIFKEFFELNFGGCFTEVRKGTFEATRRPLYLKFKRKI